MKTTAIEAHEALKERLAAQALLAKAFQSVFGLEPSVQLLEALSNPAIEESFHVMELANGEFASDFNAFRIFTNDRSSAHIERLASEFTRLFIGPSILPAPPWESVYRGEDRLLLQASTLEVRALYRSQGALPAHYPTVADDHVSLELSFLHLVSSRAYDLVAHARAPLSAIGPSLADAASEIVDKHLLKWLPQFSRALSCDDREGYYAVSARLLVRFVQACRHLEKKA